MKIAMVISPHADDAAAFCGATLAKLSDLGWHTILVRVTDDRKDSVGYTVEETMSINQEELSTAARILGDRIYCDPLILLGISKGCCPLI